MRALGQRRTTHSASGEDAEHTSGHARRVRTGRTGLRALRRVRAVALAATASALLTATATAAQAKVVFPTPGVMDVAGVPAQLLAGQHFTLAENMPDAILGGVVRFQRESTPGVWHTLASARLLPWVFWLHWSVPTQLAGSLLQVRFELTDHGQTLAMSPAYAINVTTPTGGSS